MIENTIFAQSCLCLWSGASKNCTCLLAWCPLGWRGGENSYSVSGLRCAGPSPATGLDTGTQLWDQGVIPTHSTHYHSINLQLLNIICLPPTPKCCAIKGPLLFSGGWERRIPPGGALQPVISPRPRLISAIRLLTGLTGLQRAGGAGDQVTLSPDSEQSLHQHSPRTQCTSIFLLWSSLR